MSDKTLKSNFQTNPFYQALVEIIIPFHNQHSMVAKLYSDVFATVRTNRFVLTLVDDASKNPHFVNDIKNKKVAGVRTFRSEQHKGFGAAVNLALKNPPTRKVPFVCVLQSDVRLKDTTWLFNLGTSLITLKNAGVKMVSPTTNNPLSDITELMAEGPSESPAKELATGYLPMYSFMAHRQLFAAVGPLKENPYAGGEAEDYAKMMAEKGYRQGFCPASWVSHEGRGTLRLYDNDKKAQQIVRKNQDGILGLAEKVVEENI